MKGSGILLLEDDSVYEGNFTEDLTFVGKVSASFIAACLYSCLFPRNGIMDSSSSFIPSCSPSPRPLENNIFLGFVGFLFYHPSHSQKEGCSSETWSSWRLCSLLSRFLVTVYTEGLGFSLFMGQFWLSQPQLRHFCFSLRSGWEHRK